MNDMNQCDMSESMIKVLSDETVNCHSDVIKSINQPWQLGPFDHLLVSHAVTVESVFVYQSNNQSNDQSNSHSNYQSIDQSYDQSIDQSNIQSINQSINQSDSQSVHQSINESIHESVHQSVNQSNSQSNSQSDSQSINGSINQSSSQSINQPIICPIRLKHSLNRLLDYYPHLTGRLSIDSTDRTPFINQIGVGALYRTARCDRTLESFRQSNQSIDQSNDQSNDPSVSQSVDHSINQSINQSISQSIDQSKQSINQSNEPINRLTILDLPGETLWCPFDTNIDAISINPIISVQHTVFACQSVSIGVRIHHWVTDAHGYFLFMQQLSELYEQSIDHSINQSGNQLLNQSVNQSISQSVNQSINQSFDRLIDRSIRLRHPPVIKSYMKGLYQSMNESERADALKYQPTFFQTRSTNQSDNQSNNQSNNQSKSQSNNQLNNQSNDQSKNNQSIDRKDDQSVSQTNDQSISQSVVDKQPFTLNANAVHSPIIGRVIRFSANELKSIKYRAVNQLNNQSTDRSINQSQNQSNNDQSLDQSANQSVNQSNDWISTFDALTAHLHAQVFAARSRLAQSMNQPIDQLVGDLLFPINFRSSSSQSVNQSSKQSVNQSVNRSSNQLIDLSSDYFPNGAMPVFIKFTATELSQSIDRSINHVAHSIHSLIQSLKSNDVISTMKWIAAQSNKQSIYQPFSFPGGFMVTAWNKMPMYKVHFNGQSPILVSKPFTNISLLDGFAHYMATEDQLIYDQSNDCSIDVIMSLNELVWKELDQDPQFRQYSAVN
jgi:hypothetical protein